MKWLFVLALAGASALLLYPTFAWYTLSAEDRAQREAARDRPRYLLNLGLDLKGGTHLLMELDVAKLPADADIQDALSRAIETIRNRVDQFGVGETLIARQGQRWIVIQLPGITNSEQAKSILGQTARLEFRMEDSSEAAQKSLVKIAELGSPFEKGTDGVLHVSSSAAKLVPAGSELLPGREDTYYIVSSSVPLTGAFLETAKVAMGGEYGLPVVDFKFNRDGGQIFAALTAANVQKKMAIVLDGKVFSAPVIKGKIPGGSGFIEGNFSMEEARKLAIVLRSGALPAPLKIIEERTVGPSLGEDSIRSGIMALSAGALFIFIFMAVYYRFSGIMADATLLLNIVFLLASMAYFGSTLTLPGIVGLVLTMAMAIDANVLIFERIRDELRAGKPPRIAVSMGYEKAFSAVFDSNLTTILAAAMLFQFGTGPIKGFAVTLTLGNIIALFTAVFCNRLMHESWLSNPDVENVSI